MALCPWCKVDVGELPPTSPCPNPRCKRLATDHPWLKSGAPPPLQSGLFGTGVELESSVDGVRTESPIPFALDPDPGIGLELDLAPPTATVVEQHAPTQASTGPIAYARTAAMPATASRIPSFEGELDLGAPAPVPSAPPSAPRVSNPAPAPATSGRSVLDDDDELMASGGDLALDLDVGNGAGLPSSISAPRISVPSAPLSAGSLPPASGGGARSVPVSSMPAPASEELDPFEVRALADFGAPPSNPLLSPLYAWRVVRRRGELGRALALRKEEAQSAARHAEDALVSFAERMRPAAEQAQSRALDGVRAAEELLRSRDGGMATEMDAHRAELARIDARLGVVEAELSAAQADEKRIADELARANEVKDRNVAKMKRADIEIRNATQAAASDAMRAQLQARTAEKEAIAAELARQAPALAEIEARLAASRRKLADVQQRTSTVRAERANVETQFQRRVGTRSQGVDEANRQVRAALADFARRSLRDAPPELMPAVQELEQSDEAARRADHAVRVHEAALASADQKQLVQGAIVAAGALLLVLLLLFFPLIYRALVVADPNAP